MAADSETPADGSLPQNTGPMPTNPVVALQKESQQGAAVHAFNPDASPQEKAEQAKANAPSAVSGTLPTAGATAVVTDIDPKLAKGHGKIPSISVTSEEDKKALEKKNDAKEAAADAAAATKGHTKGAPSAASVASAKSTSSVPGEFPDEPAAPYEIPDWYKVGWTALAGDDPAAKANERGLMEEWLSDMWFGQFYHNAGIIIFAILSTYLSAKLGGGVGWLFIIGAVCATYYSTSVRRVRVNARDDINRELTKSRLESDDETVDWMNNFLAKFWVIYEPVLSATIVASVDAILAASTPSFLDSLRLSTFTLGNKAPRIERVKTYPRSDDDVVLMDWSFSFVPSDKHDLTAAQLRNRVNPKIVLSIRVGKGFASAAFPILVEDIAFKGKMRIKLKLMNNFPHVQTVDLSFLERPFIDYVLKPIGGDTLGLDIANLPGLSGFIREMIHGTLGPMMYDPNVFTLNLEQMLSGASIDSAIGVLQITVYNARGLKNTDITGTIDPYVKMTINQGAELARTEVRDNTTNPQWNETKFLLLNSINEVFCMEVIDFNDYRKDKAIGMANFDLKSLEVDPEQEGVVAPVKSSGKDRGELRFDAVWYPVLAPKTLEDGTIQQPPETNSGIVRFTVHQAKDLDYKKSMVGQLSPYVEYQLNGKTVHKSKKMKRTNNPVWEESFELLVTDKKNCTLGVRVLDDRGLTADPCVGTYTIKLLDLLERNKNKQDTFPLAAASQGRIKMSALFKPVEISGVLGSGGYVPPIGVVRLHFKCARDVRNVEALSGGKSDPYTRVMINNDLKARTIVIQNDLNPVWDEILYVPVHSIKENLILEVMDYQSITKDRTLGFTQIDLVKLAKPATDLAVKDQPVWESTGKHIAEEPLQSFDRKSAKGFLVYEADFYPCIPLKDAEEDDDVEDNMQGLTGEQAAALKEADKLKKIAPALPPQAPTPVQAAKAAKPNMNGAEVTRDSLDVNGAARQSIDAPKIEGAKVNGTSPDDEALENEDKAAKKAIKDHGMTLTDEELFQRQAGILIINILEGQLARKDCYLDILLDDGYWPSYSTGRSRSARAKWDEIGEAVVKELDFSRIIFRLKQHKETEKDEIVAEVTMDTKEFLRQSLKNPIDIKIPAKSESATYSFSVKFSTKYVPIVLELDPSESINNMGELRVDVLDGQDLPAADRSGTSDPYVVFTLNEQKVHKTKVIKKTLTPTYNEHFETQVPSRTGGLFTCEVFDWNQIENAKRLGHGTIDMAKLEPFQNSTVAIPLESDKGKAAGTIRIRMVFRPQFITRTRRGTSTFSGATRIATGLGKGVVAAPLGVAKGGFAVGKGGASVVKGGVKGGLNLFRRDKQEHTIDEAAEDAAANGKISAGDAAVIGAGASVPLMLDEAGNPDPSKTVPANSLMAGPTGGGAAGTITITVVEAKDLFAVDSDGTSDPFVKVTWGKKDIDKTKQQKNTINPVFNETMNVSTNGSSTILTFQVLHHKSLGRSADIGHADVDVWEYVGPNKPTASAWIVLHGDSAGEGQLHIALQFTPQGSALPQGQTTPGQSPVANRRISSSMQPEGFDRSSTLGSVGTPEKKSAFSSLRKKL